MYRTEPGRSCRNSKKVLAFWLSRQEDIGSPEYWLYVVCSSTFLYCSFSFSIISALDLESVSALYAPPAQICHG